MDKTVFESYIKEIIEITKEYGAEKVILFGSCIEDIESARDIDVAVTGVKPEIFFEMYGKILADEIDLIPLEYTREHFAKRVLEKGKVIYARQI
ncbi:MAG: hypothetical protein AB1349_11790 [Elusimicrobiota bacterium]